jgi:hypothetical protein
MPQKTWVVGEEVLAADFNSYIQNQTIPAFTGTAQRDSQWATPPNGALCVTTDTNTLWQRVAGAWTRQTTGYQLGSVSSTTATAVGAAATDLPLSVTVTVIAGRRVRVSANCQFGSAGGIAASQITLVAQQDSVDMTAAVRQAQLVAGPANLTFDTLAFATPASGSHTWKARASSTVASGVFFQAGALEVVDVGPV